VSDEIYFQKLNLLLDLYAEQRCRGNVGRFEIWAQCQCFTMCVAVKVLGPHVR